MTDAIRVVVVDDHPVFRLGIAGLLSSLDGIELVGQADGPDQARAQIDGSVDVVLMDLDLAGESGVVLTRELVSAHPGLKVLVVTMHEDDVSVLAAMRAGARGYLLKSSAPDRLERAIRGVAVGDLVVGQGVADRALSYVASPPSGAATSGPRPFPELTDRELEVLDLVARGMGNAAIARTLTLSEKTVRNHVSNLLTKLAVRDRAGAVATARDAGLGAGV
ncbi:response regulator transcription factor [Mumia zhuanghuii]|uniref:Response regulator n=2 Tax=Mumia TaxID=1546255 RepID=A0ABW1QUG6_9ACTN|nr:MULTISPECIES: response regulator transcription factor [Mumia]KAA1425096.1 response regulator transcription factor [Mumia zhuanghuii]